jgi:hypothetical protein
LAKTALSLQINRPPHQALKHGELLPCRQQDHQHRLDDRGEHGVFRDPLPHHRFETAALPPQDHAESLEQPADAVRELDLLRHELRAGRSLEARRIFDRGGMTDRELSHR